MCIMCIMCHVCQWPEVQETVVLHLCGAVFLSWHFLETMTWWSLVLSTRGTSLSGMKIGPHVHILHALHATKYGAFALDSWPPAFFLEPWAQYCFLVLFFNEHVIWAMKMSLLVKMSLLGADRSIVGPKVLGVPWRFQHTFDSVVRLWGQRGGRPGHWLLGC